MPKKVAERLGLGRTDKYYYEKWIAKQNTETKERIVDLNASKGGEPNMEFIESLDQAAAILQKKELDDDYAVFRERYVKIRVYLENLHKAYVNKTLDNTRTCLVTV